MGRRRDPDPSLVRVNRMVKLHRGLRVEQARWDRQFYTLTVAEKRAFIRRLTRLRKRGIRV